MSFFMKLMDILKEITLQDRVEEDILIYPNISKIRPWIIRESQPSLSSSSVVPPSPLPSNNSGPPPPQGQSLQNQQNPLSHNDVLETFSKLSSYDDRET